MPFRLSTLFSILFAATFARVLRTMTLWLLEKGSKISILDQLVGSLSVSSTVVTQFYAGIRRSFASYFIGFNLIILWLLSPLGSQALLRISSLPLSYAVTNMTQPYLNVSAWYNIGGDSSDAESFLQGPNALMNAVVAGSLASKEQLTDPWGYVKIPVYSRMPQDTSDPYGWRPVAIASSDDFSSLLGLPVAFPMKDANSSTTFPVESWYWDLTCDSWKVLTSQFSRTTQMYQMNSTVSSRGNKYSGPATYIWFNSSGPTTRNSRTMEACNTASNDTRFQNTTAHVYDIIDCPRLEARTISIQLNSRGRAFVSNCQIATMYVEAEMHCANTTCRSTRIRRSVAPHLSMNWTALDIMESPGSSYYTTPGLFFGNFANAIPGRGGAWGANALSGYIIDPSNPSSANQINPVGQSTAVSLDLWNITDSLITSRLNQLLNTYWMTTVGSALVTGTDDIWRLIQEKNVSSRRYGVRSAESDTPMVVTSNGNVSTPERKLHCDLWWLVIFTTVSAMSLFSAVYGLVLTARINVPRLSMNITSMLRDNRYSDLGLAGSYLDDSDRSFIGRNTVVRIGDVAPESSTGHVALCTVDSTGLNNIIGKLEKNRLYG